jgi:hypothetical protein
MTNNNHEGNINKKRLKAEYVRIILTSRIREGQEVKEDT